MARHKTESHKQEQHKQELHKKEQHKQESHEQEIAPEKPKRKIHLGLLILGLFIIFVGCTIIGYFGGTVKLGTCQNEICFINASDQCLVADLRLQEDFGIVKYHSENCTFQKTIEQVTDPDSQDLKPVLEGKTMNCTYEKDDFDAQWVYSLTSGIEKCKGELVTTIAQLILLAE
ncbi:MAG: hypothetical protein V1729_07250 [Candidatus Woesearchaeota archaeon]